MADAYAKFQQYEYRSNSNLVLTVDRSGSRPTNEPTGEPETLAGRIRPQQFGDRARNEGIPKELRERLSKKKGKRKHGAALGGGEDEEEEDFMRAGKRGDKKRKGILEVEGEIFEGYRPKTKETQLAYERLLTFIKRTLGDQPQDVLRDAATEVLIILKDESLRAPEKKGRVEELLVPFTNEQYDGLVDIVRPINDFMENVGAGGEGDEDEEGGSSSARGEGSIDEQLGVSVVFEESESEEEDYGDILRDEDSEEEEEGEDTEAMDSLASGGKEVTMTSTAADEEDDAAKRLKDPLVVDPKKIDAYWLQRELSKFFKDALNSQKMEEEVLTILSDKEADIRRCENRLVQLLDYEKFDFIKVLLRNRWQIVFCTRLARAKNEEERQRIEEEMQESRTLRSILAALKRTTGEGAAGGDRSKEIERSIRQEARSLKAKDPDHLLRAGKGVGSIDEEASALVKGAKVLDLESLVFEAGSHLMSNTECRLPEGSYRTKHKGFEEVSVPALKAPDMDPSERLVPKEELPKFVQRCFEHDEEFKGLNRIQSRVYHAALKTADNLLICAPTGAGKTNIALLTMFHEIGLNMNEDGTVNLENFKMVYIAPMKSLVHEMVLKFSSLLQPLGITVKELSGDVNLTKQQINETQLIITTPEKWDIITRKSGDRTYTQLVRLIIIDEIHLLHDERGPVLESIIARTIRQIETTQEMIRLVGLSATLPNYKDVALLLRVDPDTGLFYFDNRYRPVPLEQQYIGVTERKALKRFQIMNEICYEKVVKLAGKHQCLIFVHSRKETAKTARALKDMAMANDTIGNFLTEASSREVLQTEVENTKNKELKELLPFGFAIHHAGMARADRDLVEDLFADGHIQVLCSTATLAWGVNLPARTVIIKGTQIYSPEKGRWVELSPLDVMQMLGRAGRPRMDTLGQGIVITSHSELQYYLSLLNQQLPIESQYLRNLPDNLNAEIVLGSIQNAKDAVEWLGYTYLYVRMMRNPTLYGISWEEFENDKFLEQRRADLIHSAATMLDKANLIRYDRKTGAFQVLDLGRVASHFYVSHSSMATYNEHLKPNMSDIELFRLFSLSEEFKYINVREEEKLELEKLLTRVPIPIKESIEDPAAKVNVLLQAYISNLRLEGFALVSDMVYVTQSAGRLMRALFEIVLKRGWANLAERCLAVCKMVDRRMWASQSPLRQFHATAEVIIKKLERKDFPFDRLYDLNSREIGELIRYPSQGKPIFKLVHKFPRLDLSASVQPITRSLVSVDLALRPDFEWDEQYHGTAMGFWVLVEDVDGERILHHEYFLLKQKFAAEEHYLKFTVPLYDPLPPQYYIRVISDRWLGSESFLPVSFRHLILPEKYPPPTELLDLRALPVSALENPAYEELYTSMGLVEFNQVQTQTFPALYQKDDNVLLAAPTSSGKTICAEFAILKMLNDAAAAQRPKVRCVYVAPLQDIVTERMEDWSERFGRRLGRKVVELTGETSADLALLEHGEIILCTPEKWDMLSRRWNVRKNVRNVDLFIVDELHLIGGENGPVLEVIVSRMRYISSSESSSGGHRIRILALSASLANARDAGEWIGATGQTCFNFDAQARPIPLEIHVTGFDHPHFGARLMAMMKPTLHAIVRYAGRGNAKQRKTKRQTEEDEEDGMEVVSSATREEGKPAIIFVPSRKHAILLAKDLRTFAASTEEPMSFLQVEDEEITPYLKPMRNRLAKDFLSVGIGLYHEGMSAQDRKIVHLLFKSGAARILIVTHSLCWGLNNLSAHLVVIMGTSYYEGKERQYADYPITDILQMTGRAGRPNNAQQEGDSIGVCVILCHAPKKDFYKKFLFEPLPVESHLDHFLHDHLNAEIVTKTIENKQDAVDYLTWTLLYRRLSQNPNYYNLTGVTHRHLSDHLSEVVENTLTDLQTSNCIAVENDMDLMPLNLGMIAAYYYIKYTTIDLFSSSLKANTKLKGLLEILSYASEYDAIGVRHKEAAPLRKLAHHCPLKIGDASNPDSHIKANVLLQTHLSRHKLPSSDLERDRDEVIAMAPRLLQAMVDVISSGGWLNPALACMDLCQMVTQGLWGTDSPLKQIPHFNEEILKRCAEHGVEGVADILDLEDEDRAKILAGLSPSQLQDVAHMCNAYPDIELDYSLQLDDDEEEKGGIPAGDSVTLAVSLKREVDEDVPDAAIGTVVAPLFPQHQKNGTRQEGWWLVLGDPKTNALLSIKRLAVKRKAKAALEFVAPEKAGTYQYKLYFISDAYAGCDQEYDVEVKVRRNEEADDEEEDAEAREKTWMKRKKRQGKCVLREERCKWCKVFILLLSSLFSCANKQTS
ncbi:U5 small nuclear ribonucleoprotein helicase [Balamuthia mandrillaris]